MMAHRGTSPQRASEFVARYRLFVLLDSGLLGRDVWQKTGRTAKGISMVMFTEQTGEINKQNLVAS